MHALIALRKRIYTHSLYVHILSVIWCLILFIHGLLLYPDSVGRVRTGPGLY